MIFYKEHPSAWLFSTRNNMVEFVPSKYVFWCARACACPRQAGGVRVVFLAMQRLVGNADVQVHGADMLQTLINEEPQVMTKHKEVFPNVLCRGRLLSEGQPRRAG